MGTEQLESLLTMAASKTVISNASISIKIFYEKGRNVEN